jgi:hypothetical protein
MSQHASHAGQGFSHELCHGGSARGTHRAHDTTTSCHNLKIGSTSDSEFEFVLSRTGKNGVRVRIDEPWHDDASIHIDLAQGAMAPPYLGSGAHGDNAPVGDSQGAIMDWFQPAHIPATLGAIACQRQELACAMHHTINSYCHATSSAKSFLDATIVYCHPRFWSTVLDA